MRKTLRLLAIVSSPPSSSKPPVRSRGAPPPPPPTPRRPGKPPPPISLEHFVQRQRVVSLWRSVVRALHKVPRAHRAEPMQYARNEFERHRHVTDLTQIRYLISTGKTEFEGMMRYIEELAGR